MIIDDAVLELASNMKLTSVDTVALQTLINKQKEENDNTSHSNR